jgi:hypothetical protein
MTNEHVDGQRPAVKIEGARIFCVRCGARPYPELSATPVREDFDLMKLGADGRPSDSGKWFCSQHFKRLGGDRYELVGGEQ